MSDAIHVSSAALYVHPARRRAIDVARDVAAKLVTVGIEPIATPQMADVLALDDVRVVDDAADIDADLAIAIGGDGTLLHAFSELGHLPIVGINCGKLGFLAYVGMDERGQLAENAAAGVLEVEERLVLEATFGAAPHAGDMHGPVRALNDVTLQKGSGRAPYVDVTIDGAPYASFLTDSLILSTPTGSTAYNFSAGGPLLTPDLDAYVLTPVAPHSLWDRSIVLGADTEVGITIVGDRDGAVIVDGREAAHLDVGGVIRVRAAPKRARLVHWEREHFIRRVHDTFNLDQTRHRSVADSD